MSARVPECQKKGYVLDQYGAERFGRLIFDKIKKSVGLKGLRKYQIIYQGRGCIKPAVAAIIAEVRGKFG